VTGRRHGRHRHHAQLLGDLLDARSVAPAPWSASPFPLSASGTLGTGPARKLQNSFGWSFLLHVNSAHHTTQPHADQPNPTRRAGCKVISWAPHSKTSPASPVSFSFSSLIPTIYRPAASTACSFSSFLPATSPRKFCIAFTTVRTYASAKKPKMPPKKAVKEEKVLLGRPGNSLKSGIVSESPAWCGCRVLTLTVVARSA
jgi:hypothetical protein